MKKRIKCPYCGSNNTAEILYGMPAYDRELESKLKRKELILGGCCIGINEPQMHCNSCKKDFATMPFVDEDTSEGAYYQVRQVVFEVGGYFGGYYLLVIIANTDGADLALVKNPGEETLSELHLTQRRWETLLDKLFGKLYIHEWKEEYIDEDILDGTQWSLKIDLDADHIIKTGGSNAFPPYWEELLQTFRYYSGVPELG